MATIKYDMCNQKNSWCELYIAPPNTNFMLSFFITYRYTVWYFIFKNTYRLYNAYECLLIQMYHLFWYSYITYIPITPIKRIFIQSIST